MFQNLCVEKFSDLLSQYPHFKKYFDFEELTLDLVALEKDSTKFSVCEVVLACLLVNVWLNERRYAISVFDMAFVQSTEVREVIIKWLQSPFIVPNGRKLDSDLLEENA